MTAAPVLVVQHEDQCPPAWFGDWMDERGCVFALGLVRLTEPATGR